MKYVTFRFRNHKLLFRWPQFNSVKMHLDTRRQRWIRNIRVNFHIVSIKFGMDRRIEEVSQYVLPSATTPSQYATPQSAIAEQDAKSHIPLPVAPVSSCRDPIKVNLDEGLDRQDFDNLRDIGLQNLRVRYNTGWFVKHTWLALLRVVWFLRLLARHLSGRAGMNFYNTTYMSNKNSKSIQDIRIDS